MKPDNGLAKPSWFPLFLGRKGLKDLLPALGMFGGQDQQPGIVVSVVLVGLWFFFSKNVSTLIQG